MGIIQVVWSVGPMWRTFSSSLQRELLAIILNVYNKIRLFECNHFVCMFVSFIPTYTPRVTFFHLFLQQMGIVANVLLRGKFFSLLKLCFNILTQTFHEYKKSLNANWWDWLSLSISWVQSHMDLWFGALESIVWSLM